MSAVPASADDIFELYAGAIRSGQLGGGERLPTIRQTAKRYNVAQATAARAYKALEQEGLVVARTGAGTRVSPDAAQAPQEVVEHIRELIEIATQHDLAFDQVVAVARALWTARE